MAKYENFGTEAKIIKHLPRGMFFHESNTFTGSDENGVNTSGEFGNIIPVGFYVHFDDDPSGEYYTLDLEQFIEACRLIKESKKENKNA